FLLQLDHLREAFLLDLEANADRVERALHQLVELPIALGGHRAIADDERPAIWLAAVAVGALAVPIALEERVRRSRVIRDRVAVLRIVPGDARRDRVVRAHRL